MAARWRRATARRADLRRHGRDEAGRDLAPRHRWRGNGPAPATTPRHRRRRRRRLHRRRHAAAAAARDYTTSIEQLQADARAAVQRDRGRRRRARRLSPGWPAGRTRPGHRTSMRSMRRTRWSRRDTGLVRRTWTRPAWRGDGQPVVEVGHALDAFRPAAALRMSGATGALFTPLYALPGASLPQVLEQLSPTIYGDVLPPPRGTWRGFAEQVAGQLDARPRGGPRGHSTAPGPTARRPERSGFGNCGRLPRPSLPASPVLGGPW